MITFSLVTLGCKVNFYESEWIREQLAAAGGVDVGEKELCPDWAIVNTCTVTGRADRQSRQILYRINRRCPDTRILVTGCYADRDPATLTVLPGVAHVVPNGKKKTIPGIVIPPLDSSPKGMMIRGLAGHVRAYLAVQNGCDARCAYCIIPSVRGRSRSKPIARVLKEMDALKKSGHPEIVLCGIHLGLYGRDLSPKVSLADLIGAMDRQAGEIRIRISSLEPMELTEEMIRRVAGSDTICPHFHIPLQSGSERILRVMRRPYSPVAFADLVRKIRHHIPHATIGTDIMVGFPGESEADFEEGYRFVASLSLSYLHVFPYSARPGTPAHAMGGQVPEHVKKSRAARFLVLGKALRKTFYRSWIGQIDEVVFERQEAPGRWVGKSRHYLPVRVSSLENLEGCWLPVRLTAAGETCVEGKLLRENGGFP